MMKNVLNILTPSKWKGIPWKYPVARDYCKQIQQQKNIDAFINVIRCCEGTDGPNGYIMLYGGGLFHDMNQHPNKKITAGGYTSTAAGIGQFLYSTWKEIKQQEGLHDFGPESQRKGIINRIKKRGALQDVKDGKIEQAVRKCSWEWASFPPGQYGQPIKTMPEIERYFIEEGGKMAKALKSEGQQKPL